MDLKPVYDQIIIERIEDTDRPIYMPNPDRTGPKFATVLAVGPGRPSEYSGTMLPPPPCQVGDTILFHGGAGTMVRHEGKDLWFIFPRDMMAVVG